MAVTTKLKPGVAPYPSNRSPEFITRKTLRNPTSSTWTRQEAAAWAQALASHQDHCISDKNRSVRRVQGSRAARKLLMVHQGVTTQQWHDADRGA